MTSNDTSTSPPSSGPWTPPNGIKAKYDLHCHCGAIRYTMELSPPLFEEETQGKERCTAVECHCSFCERNGCISVHPFESDVVFTQGIEHRVSYYTASKKCPQWFCGKCGSVIGTDLSWIMKNIFHDQVRYTINLRMLKDFDMRKLQTRQEYFMKDQEPKYEV